MAGAAAHRVTPPEGRSGERHRSGVDGAALGAGIVLSLAEESQHTAMVAVDNVLAALPADFPLQLAESVRNGLQGSLSGLTPSPS